MISQTSYLKYLLISGSLILIYIFYAHILSGGSKEDKSDATKLDAIPLVDIDYRGKFKYILVQVMGKNAAGRMVLNKFIVRGSNRFSHHADICDNVRDAVAEHGLKAKCIGGGRIEHYPDSKKMKIYGFSRSYGKADHKKTRSILLPEYPGYIIETSDTGY